jgi:hypothetical protein
MTDTNGRYNVGGLPNGTAQLFAASARLDQPCAVIAEVSGPNAVANIELVSPANQPLADSLLTFPRLRGDVLEKISELEFSGISTLGARAYYESSEGSVAATATVVGNATFEMCNLPTFGATRVYVVKAGFPITEYPVVIKPGIINTVIFRMVR